MIDPKYSDILFAEGSRANAAAANTASVPTNCSGLVDVALIRTMIAAISPVIQSASMIGFGMELKKEFCLMT